jgi:hypothetical protein
VKLSAPCDTALVRASFPLFLLFFLFHCSYSSFPKSFLLFSYLHAPLPPILLFFSPLRHLSTKLNGVKSQIIILLNTHHHENLESERYCLFAYLSIMPKGIWESGGLTPYILEFSTKCGWSASCLSHSLNRRLGGPLIRSLSFGKDKNWTLIPVVQPIT